MKKLLMMAAAVVVSASVGAGVAVAAVGVGLPERQPDPPATTGATEGITAAEAPKARVAVWIDGGATEGQFAVIRAKGVASVTNPDPGLWCIRPNVAGFHPSKVVPVASVEFSGSTTTNDLIQWVSLRTLCPAGTLEFLSFESGSGAPNNATSFTVVIP